MKEPSAGVKPEGYDIPVHVNWLLNLGIKCDFAFTHVDEPWTYPNPPHKHPVDEFLFWLGGDPTNMLDFGAEVELTLGEGEDQEVHTVTHTSVIYIPAGLSHLPMVFKKVTKPLLCGHILMAPGYIK
jgi:hypothetical protein